LQNLTCFSAVAGFHGIEAAISKIPLKINQTQKLAGLKAAHPLLSAPAFC